MALEISAKKMAVYRATARQHQQQKEQRLALRYQRAWKVAQQAAAILKEQFGVQRVVIFGSTLWIKRFHHRSDVDLAVWGLDEKVYYRAVVRLLDIEPTISVDLIEAEFASPALLKVIEQEGVTLGFES